jgi:hypothetical protein
MLGLLVSVLASYIADCSVGFCSAQCAVSVLVLAGGWWLLAGGSVGLVGLDVGC